VRVWIDITNSPQVLVFRPLIALLERRGHTVEVTARDYAQTLDLLSLHGLAHDVVGPGHAGAQAWDKARTMAARLRGLRSWAKGRGFDLALSHASHELPLAARSLRIPSAYAFDYEFARAQHTFGSRAATRVVVPEAIPQHRLDRLGARRSKVRRYPGLKEEYYLAGFEPDERVLGGLGIAREHVLAVLRTPPDVSLYHRHGNVLFADVLRRLGSDPGIRAVVLPRTPEQRAAVEELALPSLVLPAEAVDAQSLVAFADLVVSAGGTMNREAVALGIPAYTTFAGRMGAVDEQLVQAGRLRVLSSAESILLEKRDRRAARVGRDPALLLDLLVTALER
jgi:predicted glycosyltransferase